MSEILKDTTANTIGTGSGGLKLDPAGTDIVTIGNGVMLPDGVKTAPAIRFTDDNNTGIYSPVNDQVSITGQGEDALLVTGVASSVNVIEVKPSATGSPVEINATGTDTNISVNVTPKGTGTLKVAGTDVSLSGHTHTGVYEPADATILKDADIGVTVQAYDATIVVDADIGVSVAAQGHNHDSAYVSVVTTPTTGNFPVLTTGGELDNSSYSAASFATAAHNHTGTYEPANANIQSHVSSTSNPHSVTAAQVGAYTSGAVDTLLTGKSDTSHSHTIDGLSDVTITTPASGNVLSYNGSAWVNSAPAGGGADSRIASYPATPSTLPVVGTGTYHIAIGDGAVTSGAAANVVALGLTRAVGTRSIAINTGFNTSSYGAKDDDCIAMGYQTSAGTGSYARKCIAIGFQSNSTGGSSVSLGQYCASAGAQSVAIGYNTYASASAIHIGTGSGQAAAANAINIGYSGNANGIDSIKIGRGNIDSGATGTICMGTISTGGSRGTVAIGYHNSSPWYGNAGLPNNTVVIGLSASTSCNGQISFGTGAHAYDGTRQSPSTGFIQAWYKTTTSTPARLGTNSSTDPSVATEVPTGYMTINNNQVVFFTTTLLAYRNGATNAATFTIKGMIKRGASAATTAFIGTPSITQEFDDSSGLTTASVSVTANATNGSYDITVTGIDATNIRWFASTQIASAQGTF